MNENIMHVITLKIPELKPVIELIEEELLFARDKFPANKMMLHALHEEVGEASQAMLNQYHANLAVDTDPVMIQQMNKKIKKELTQVICMAIRVLQEGDHDFPYHP